MYGLHTSTIYSTGGIKTLSMKVTKKYENMQLLIIMLLNYVKILFVAFRVHLKKLEHKVHFIGVCYKTTPHQKLLSIPYGLSCLMFDTTSSQILDHNVLLQ